MNAEYKHQWYLQNRDRILKQRKKYRVKLLSKIRAYDRKRNAVRRKDPNYIKQWSKRAKIWVAKNRDKINAQKRATRIRHPLIKKTKEELALKARLRNRKYYYKHKKRDKNAMKERDFGILFRHWIRANPQKTASFELKDTRGEDTFKFCNFEAHQIDYANAIKNGSVLIRVQGVSGEPDYIYMNHAPAYVVIRYPDFFCLIDVDRFVKEEARSRRRSLVAFRARQIAYKVVEL